MPDPAPPGRKAVFLDRDGTLMAEENYCADPARVRAVAGAGTAMADLRAAGWWLVMVTNQSGIGRGWLTVADYEAVNAELFRQLGTTPDAVYFCPDAPDRPTPRRKPGTGMLDDAVRDHGIALGRSWFVGDKDVDVLCGRTAGCRTILVQTGYGANFTSCGADFVAKDIAEAARHILASSP